jgi:hypothetical protein
MTGVGKYFVPDEYIRTFYAGRIPEAPVCQTLYVNAAVPPAPIRIARGWRTSLMR